MPIAKRSEGTFEGPSRVHTARIERSRLFFRYPALHPDVDLFFPNVFASVLAYS